MRRLLLGCFSIVVVVALTVGPAMAGKTVTVTQIDESLVQPYVIPGAVIDPTCTFGNLNAAAWAISGFVLPPEEYALIADPIQMCDHCQPGVMVNTIHVLLQVSAPCDIVMSVNMREVAYPVDPTCPMPDVSVCDSGNYNVSLPQAGSWGIALPITCPCKDVNRRYSLGVYITSSTCTPDLVTDALPTLCTSYNNFGAGWGDLLADYPTWPGNLKIWADADCCSPPVPVEESTWGQIKSLYED